MSDDRLTELMDDMLRIQKDMAAKQVEHRGHILGVEFAVLAIAEQLVASGHLDAPRAAGRILDLAKRVEPDRFRDMVQPQIDGIASRLRDLGLPKGPRPPRGSKPRIVK